MDLLTYYTVMGRAAAVIPLTGEHREGDACVVRAGVGVGSSLRADRRAAATLAEPPCGVLETL